MLRMVKTSYGKLRRLNFVEAAYIAGLIDGDGTITLTRHNNRRRTKKEYRRLEVKISNADFKLLKQVKSSVEAGQIARKRPRNKRHAMGYAYRICNRQAFNLLIQISPYLKTYKRNRAELVLKNYIKLTPRNGKYSPKLLAQKKKFIKTFFSIPSPRKIKPKLAPYY